MRDQAKRWLPWIALVVVVIGFANFIWFMAEGAALGGDALNGYVSDGQYFVRNHGTVTEVTQSQWQWSRVHGLSMVGTHLLAMVGMAYLLFRVFFPAMLPSQGPGVSKRLELVRASGPVQASRRCAGQLGDLRLSGPLLGVDVYPAGIVVAPPFMTPVVLMTADLKGVSWDRSWGTNRLTIDYRPGAWSGAIRLFINPGDPLAGAIEGLVAARDPGEGAGASSAPPSDVAGFAKYPLIYRVWVVGALVLSVPFLLIWTKPGLNPSFVFGLVIIVFNVYWFIIRGARRW